MSHVIRVSGTRMTGDQEKIGEELELIEKNVNELAEAMRSLGECWEGPAWNAFHNSVADSIEEMIELKRFMGALLKAESDAYVDYQMTEGNNRDILRCVKI